MAAELVLALGPADLLGIVALHLRQELGGGEIDIDQKRIVI